MKKTKNKIMLEIKQRCPALTNKEIEEYFKAIIKWYEEQLIKFKKTKQRIDEIEEQNKRLILFYNSLRLKAIEQTIRIEREEREGGKNET